MAAEKKKRELRMGTISKAYCYETDSMDGSWLAMEKLSHGRDLHYFCPTKTCAYPMKGTRFAEREDYDIVSFISQDTPDGETQTHVEGCPFGRKKQQRSAGNGQSTPPRYTPTIVQPFFPVCVIDPGDLPVRKWPTVPPSREELRGFVAEADERPPFGLIEDFMAADRMMADAFREYSTALDRYKADPNSIAKPKVPIHVSSRKDLIVSGSVTTYKAGIVYIDNLLKSEERDEAEFWATRIARFTGWPKNDLRRGGYYLNSRKGGISIWISPSALVGSGPKAYIKDLFERQTKAKGRIHCYWWGIKPNGLEEDGGPHLWFESPAELLRVGFQEASPATPMPSARDQSQSKPIALGPT